MALCRKVGAGEPEQLTACYRAPLSYVTTHRLFVCKLILLEIYDMFLYGCCLLITHALLKRKTI